MLRIFLGFPALFLISSFAFSSSHKSLSNTPFALHGARAEWVSAEEVLYLPTEWLGLSGMRVEAIQVESGRRVPFQIVRPEGNRWRLRVADKSFSENAKDHLREPFVFFVFDKYGNEVDRTYFQIGELLDHLYRYEGCLGVCWEGGEPTLRVWAPTARSVRLQWIEDGREGSIQEMKLGSQGEWEIRGRSSWRNKRYQYLVEVFTPTTGKMEVHKVSDPYSVALGLNSAHSIIFDPNDTRWMPEGWSSTRRPTLEARTDSVFYELHIRDFSSGDATVPEDLRGKYLAFTKKGTAGDNHLRALADSGVTHIHLLPVHDFATVEEDPRLRRDPRIPLGLPPDSPLPQQTMRKFRAFDSFNWGYDPFHFFAPEGSYATDPDGAIRVKEFRALVQSLHERGLRVVLDMVFNHTYSSGIASDSVLDRIVPGYYYRLDESGQVKNSSCCSDTASERWMMEKLMRDSLESWRSVFRVDGFRFDLMNLHSVHTMKRIRDELREKDSSIVLYGEAWPFGSLVEKAPNDAYLQSKAYGQGIGIFNDRIRDAVRGGTTDSKEKSDQGFLTGLFYDFNHEPANRNTPVDLGAQREKLLWLTDVVRAGLAGNLRDFRFRNYRGELVRAGDIRFHGGAVGFAANPEDTVNYLSAHDGYTFFDALQAKLPFHARWRDPGVAPMQERVERQILGAALLAFSQGTPFFDSGFELLRSKSGDQNSYDSGDWFNSIDWLGKENGWGRGLPSLDSNPESDWAFWRPRLADRALMAQEPDIQFMKENFFALLKLRKSSPLFRLRTGAEVQSRVRFWNAELGPMQRPGLIVMEILDEEAGRDLDKNWRRMIVAFNATNESAAFSHPSLRRGIPDRLFGKGDVQLSREAQLVLPPRSVTVWGEEQ